jgi:hypothetical protein
VCQTRPRHGKPFTFPRGIREYFTFSASRVAAENFCRKGESHSTSAVARRFPASLPERVDGSDSPKLSLIEPRRLPGLFFGFSGGPEAADPAAGSNPRFSRGDAEGFQGLLPSPSLHDRCTTFALRGPGDPKTGCSHGDTETWGIQALVVFPASPRLRERIKPFHSQLTANDDRRRAESRTLPGGDAEPQIRKHCLARPGAGEEG